MHTPFSGHMHTPFSGQRYYSVVLSDPHFTIYTLASLNLSEADHLKTKAIVKHLNSMLCSHTYHTKGSLMGSDILHMKFSWLG